VRVPGIIAGYFVFANTEMRDKEKRHRDYYESMALWCGKRTRGVATGSGWERRPTALWKLARAYDYVVADDRFFRVTPLVVNRVAGIGCSLVARRGWI
jgi:hypothetical protein